MVSGKNRKIAAQTKIRQHNVKQRSDLAGLKSLSEAIILQSLEDIWIPAYREESLEFFTEEGFNICSEIAGLDTSSQSIIIHLLGGNKHVSTT